MHRQALPALFFLAATSLLAQQAPLQHAPDRIGPQHLESIDVLAVPNQPFTATLVTEWTRIMPDGSKTTNWNHRLIVRDSSGRVFQERRYFSPTGNTQETLLSQLQYDDPNTRERTVCDPTPKVCRVSPLPYAATIAPQTVTRPAQLKLANGTTIQNEDLGHNTLFDLDCGGTREITTIPAGAIGNQKPQPIIREFWYSPQLSLNLITKRFDPRTSTIANFTVTQLTLTEPDPKTFTPPEGYTLLRTTQQ